MLIKCSVSYMGNPQNTSDNFFILQALLRAPPVLEFVRNFDYQFYQNLVEVLIPDVLKSIPSSLTQAIRNFAKSLESWLSSAMLGCPPDIVNIKVR